MHMHINFKDTYDRLYLLEKHIHFMHFESVE